MIVESNAAERAMERTMRNLTQAKGEVVGLASSWSANVYASAPKDTTRMAHTVSLIEPTNVVGDDVGFGVGPFDRLGYPTNNAPRGLIGRFVQNNPDLRGAMPPVPRAAWWYLARGGKEKLKVERTGEKPAYWQAVQEQAVPSKDGGILPTIPYITLANNAIRHIVKRIDDLLGHP